MSRFIEGENRHQSTLFPERVDDYVEEDSGVRVVDVFIDRLDISGLGFKADHADTGRPGYHPRTLLKIYVFGIEND
jgi:transposase